MSLLLLTGSGSKFAEPLLRRLASRFESVTLLSRKSPHRLAQGSISGIHFDLAASHKIPVKADVVLHLAAAVPYNQDCGRSADVLGENLRCFLNVMRYAAAARARVIFVSSTDVYPLLVEDPLREDTPPKPHNEYGLSKLACERLGGTISGMSSVPLTILRVGPVYSESDASVNRVSGMLDALRRHEPIAVSHPRNVPSLLNLESAADGIATAVSAAAGTYVIAGRPVPIGEFFLRAKRAYATSGDVALGPETERTVHIPFDLSRSSSALGWEPYAADALFRAGSST